MYILNENESEEKILLSVMEEHGISFCMLSYYEQEKHIMFLSNLNVSKKFRRKGYGNDILNYAIKYAKSHGGEYLYLFTIDKNSWITKWYNRKGFITFNIEDGGCNMFLDLKKYKE